MMRTLPWEAIVIGAGFAGASTAWWLRRRGLERILILEKEAAPGRRASGQNAGIARLAVSDGATARLTSRGGAFLRNPPDGFSEEPLFEPTGGILLCGMAEGLEEIRLASEPAGIRLTALDRRGVLDLIPFLEDSPFRAAYHCPDDGLVDIHAYLGAFLRGSSLRVKEEVRAFEKKGDRIHQVVTDKGTYETERVVLAGGSYNGRMGGMAGGVPIPMTPRRRHLVFSGPLEWIPKNLPYAWFQSPEAYFKPESGGLLLSPCDEADVSPDSPHADPEATTWLYDRLGEVFPSLQGIPIARTWAELRCFVPDRRFVIGADPRISNLTWVAALGGHGMTSSAAVGELASALALGEPAPVDPAPYDPARFG